MSHRKLGLIAIGMALAAVGPAGPAAGAVPPSASPAAAHQVVEPPAAPDDRVSGAEVFEADGTIRRAPSGRSRNTPRSAPKAQSPVAAGVVPIQQTGPTGTRYDLVFLGDGYTAGQIPLFHDQVVARWREMTAYEPFKSLKDSFNVWEVDVISQESGTDNDPYGVLRNTALGSGLWCDNIDRLLCLDETVAKRYAALAPAFDQIAVLANTSTYGGGGGGWGQFVAAATAGNPLSVKILLHELGHHMAGLADEYYANERYTGGEPTAPNVSTLNREAMLAAKTKWYRDLDRSTPDGGVIGAYEGAGGAYEKGLYRPSDNSLMRSVAEDVNSFNLVCVDALTSAIKFRLG